MKSYKFVVIVLLLLFNFFLVQACKCWNDNTIATGTTVACCREIKSAYSGNPPNCDVEVSSKFWNFWHCCDKYGAISDCRES